MNLQFSNSCMLLSLFAAGAFITAGCNQADNTNRQAKDETSSRKIGEVKADGGSKDDSGWWCAEHGVPEEVCSMCNAKVAALFKKNGDWCNEHDRAKSQCFKCDPKLKDKFAAQYRAKYGKEPPPLEDDNKSEQQNEDKKG